MNDIHLCHSGNKRKEKRGVRRVRNALFRSCVDDDGGVFLVNHAISECLKHVERLNSQREPPIMHEGGENSEAYTKEVDIHDLSPVFKTVQSAFKRHSLIS